jgi:hypothetical protein
VDSARQLGVSQSPGNVLRPSIGLAECNTRSGTPVADRVNNWSEPWRRNDGFSQDDLVGALDLHRGEMDLVEQTPEQCEAGG